MDVSQVTRKKATSDLIMKKIRNNLVKTLVLVTLNHATTKMWKTFSVCGVLIKHFCFYMQRLLEVYCTLLCGTCYIWYG